MSRDITTTVTNRLDGSVVRPLYAVELLFDGSNALRLWTGYGDLTYDGETWTGAGSLLGVDFVQETADIAVKGAEISLTGINSEIVSLALSEPYQGRVCNVYFGLLDPDGGLTVAAGDLTQIFSGYMDQMNISEQAETSTISLTVENRLIDLERARVARYTSAYQKSIYPNDLGLDFIEDLQDKQLTWGKKAE